MARVLIVDDEIDTLNLLRTILDLSGHQATTTLNSVDAITLAEMEQPDCILLDIMMPQLDGFTLCKMMRLHPATAHLPIVFVTAYSALDLEDRRKEAGADMVLPKPIGMDTLIEAVEAAISLRHPSAPAAPLYSAASNTPLVPTQTPIPNIIANPAGTASNLTPLTPPPAASNTPNTPNTSTAPITPTAPTAPTAPNTPSSPPHAGSTSEKGKTKL